MRSLTLDKRRELLRLTARSGSLANLQLLLPLVGCTPEYGCQNPVVLVNAAKAGHLQVCQWLRQQGSSWDKDVMMAAGESGSWQVCEWAIAGGSPGGASAAMLGAARAGHVGLLDRLLAAHGLPSERDVKRVLAAVAEGCDLATLQRLYASWFGSAPGGEEEMAGILAKLAGRASSSPTPDWRAKVEWLEAAGCRPDQPLSLDDCPDAVERLAWLGARGWPTERHGAIYNAARRGDLACLEFLSPLQPSEQQTATRMLAVGGHLPALQALHARGWALDSLIDMYAAGKGHLQVVIWAVDTLAAEVLTVQLFDFAALSGNLQLLAWLRGRGCPCRSRAWAFAADSGCEEVLDWLDTFAPLSLEDDITHLAVVRSAASGGDLATLACLRRLGCVWAEDGRTFTAATYPGQLPVLRWLVEQGCPVDWGAVMRDDRGMDAGVRAWVEEQAAARGHVAGVQELG